MISKQKSFEIFVIAVNAQDYGTNDDEQLISAIESACKTSKTNAKTAVEKSLEALKHFKEIDTKIKKASKKYNIERISKIEKSIIRSGIYASCYDGLGKNITISECIRLTQKFGNPSAINFVHAILDHSIT